MTTLALTKTFIAPIADTSNTLIINQSAQSENLSDSTRVRTYAGGVQRVVSTLGRSKRYPIRYRRMSRANYDALTDLISVPILFRDQRGRAIRGVIASMNAIEDPQTDQVESVSFTVEAITQSEIV
jgi:hypothetical protein